MNQANDGGEARHPIGVVAERTGLSTDLLRAWERRYEAVSPSRDPAGQRLYSDADVGRLRLLHLAVSGGRSIGQVARLPLDALQRLVEEDSAYGGTEEARGSALAPDFDLARAEAAYEGMDPEALESLLRRSLGVLGMPRFLEEVAAPVLRRIGERWHEGRLSPAQEHLATATMQRVIIRGMDGLTPRPMAPTLVVATPRGERHEIGALLAAAVAAAEGWRVVYLGPDLPAEEIAQAARRADARAVGVSVVYVSDPERVAGELARLRSRLPGGVALLAGGAGAAALAPELRRIGVGVFTALPELREALRDGRLAPAAP